MKKFLFTTIFFFSILIFASATHNRGGEITVRQIDYLQYEATIHTFTKASSIPADRDSLEICWGDGTCEWIFRDSSELINNDTKLNWYSAPHTYNIEGDYLITMTDPNRNGGILNVDPPVSDNVPFHLQTFIKVTSLTNSTPSFLNEVNYIAIAGAVFQHNVAAVDIEGDSLSYQLITPYQATDTPVPNYSFPNELMPGTNNSIGIHSELGTITWDSPQLIGEYAITIEITEYRSGIMMSKSIRDMQIIVVNGLTSPPAVQLSTMIPTNLELGDTISFEINGTDQENAEIRMHAYGSPFSLSNPPIFSAPTDFQSAPINASFYWEVPNDITELVSPYYLVFKLEEKMGDTIGLATYEVLKLNILGLPTNTSLPRPTQEIDINIFPNPIVENLLYIRNNEYQERKPIEIQISSEDGRVLLEKSLDPTFNVQSVNIEQLSRGILFLKIISGNKVITKQILKL